MTKTLFNQCRPYLSSTILLSALAFVGCSDSDNPINPPGSTEGGPKVGSRYSYHVTSAYSNGMVNELDFNNVVAATGVAYAGKTNVVKMTTDLPAKNQIGETGYFVYETNGDLTGFFPVNMNGQVLDSTWLTYTFGSKGPMIYPNWDKDAAGMHTTVTGTGTYLGTEQLTVGSETFETMKMATRMDISMKISGMSTALMTTSYIDTAWYAPRIFNMVKNSSVNTSMSAGTTSVIRINKVLTSYKLQ